MARAVSLGVGSVLVIARLAVEAAEDDKDDPANNRNERKQPPPAATPCVMQAAEKHGETRNQDCKRIKQRDYSQDGKPRHTNQCTGNKLENRGRDEIEKHEQPVFLTASAAREAGIFLCETVNEVVHVLFVLFVLSGTMPDG